MDHNCVATQGAVIGAVSWPSNMLSLTGQSTRHRCRVTARQRLLPAMLLALVALWLASLAAPAAAQTVPAQTIWRLRDYIAVDYPEAVDNGAIVNPTEFDEMVEF